MQLYCSKQYRTTAAASLHAGIRGIRCSVGVPIRRSWLPRSSYRSCTALQPPCLPGLPTASTSTSCSASRSYNSSSSSSSTHRSSRGLLLLAAARRRGTDSGDAAAAGAADASDADPSALTRLSLPELKQRCADLGLPTSGRKADLAARIANHLQQQQQQQQDQPAVEQQQQEPSTAAAAPEAAAAAGGGGDDDGLEVVSFEELLAELTQELKSYSKDELISCLAERNLPAEGRKPQLVDRLARALAEETLAGQAELEAAAASQQQPPAQTPAAAAATEMYEQEGALPAWAASGVQQQEQEQQQQQPGSSSAAGSSEREWLIADKQQALFDELLAMGVLREELVDILQEMGQSAAEEETLEELAERASWLLAEEEVLLMEQQATAAGGGSGGGGDDAAAAAREAIAEHPSSILDGLSATDINKMKVDELRRYLLGLGLSDEGSRYVLRDRLLTMLVVRRAATGGDMDYLLRQLSQMTLSELRSDLERRGLDLGGTKAALELRLAQAMVVEVAGPEAAAAVGLIQTPSAQQQTEGFQLQNPLLEDYDEVLTAVLDPAFRVALLCGTAPAAGSSSSGSSSSSSSSSDWGAVAQALATAVTLIDELHTAPLDEQQAAAMAAAAAAAADASGSSSSSTTGKGRRKSTSSKGSRSGSTAAADVAAEPGGEQATTKPNPTKIPVCGINVDVYWADDNGVFYQLPRTALAATAAADLAACLPALATARFENVTDLAQHLAASGAGAALSTLAGGALAMSGQLAEACAAAGVPMALQPPAGSSSSSSGSAAQPVLGRAAVLQQLQDLGYMTLPVLTVTREEVLESAEEVQAWLEALHAEADAEEDEETAAAAAEAAPEEGQESSAEAAAPGSSRRRRVSSALLRAWSAARYEGGDAAVEADEGEEGAEMPLPPFVEKVAAWCGSEGLDPDMQLFSLARSEGGELLDAVRGVERVISWLLLYASDSDAAGSWSVLVEPLHRQLSRWEVVVLTSPDDGPVALLPSEVEAYSTKQELADADLALKEWQMMQAGLEPESISNNLELLAATEPDCVDTLKLPDLPDPLPHHTLKIHSPPRSSHKLIQTMRHAAAKAVSQLGLGSAGLVRVRGWFALKPDWQEAYKLPPEAIKKMPDADPKHLQRIRAEILEARAQEALPLTDYYDEVLHIADLERFDPSARCRAEGNGEGDVLLADVDVDVPLHSTSLAGLQASEVGLSPGGLARHLINVALVAAGGEPLLPPAPRPTLSSSAQWAPVSGANDSELEIVAQLADAAVEARENWEMRHVKMADAARMRAFAALPVEAAIREVVDGLSLPGITLDVLAQDEPELEEWEPEFDPRTLEEIHAERDAHRPAEDLAARQMRDDNMPFYGDQPIEYDRFDQALDWEPPFAAAAAAGKPIPSIEQLRQEQAERVAERNSTIAGPLSEAERLPDATEDEVMVGRLLGYDRYQGGVKETLQRRQEQMQDTAGGGAASTAAAASAAYAAAGAAAGEAAAVQAAAAAAGGGEPSEPAWAAAAAAGSSGGLIAESEQWPWPSVEQVLDEAAERRAAPRVWVLMGGDGPGRQQALRSGANIWAKLKRCCDLQVDAFLLPPAGSGVDETRRRAALLARRTEWQALGIPEDMYPPSMSDDALLSMPPTDLLPVERSVVVLGPSQLSRHSVEEAAEAAERLAARAAAAYHSAAVQQQQQLQSQAETQLELDAHLVMGVGVGWGGDAAALPPPPRWLDIEEFIREASACEATVILATQDALTATGELQQLLELAGVGYTGMTADFAMQCCNRIALNKSIRDVAESLAVQPAAAAAAAGDQQAAAAAAADESAGDDADLSEVESSSASGLIPMPIKVLKTDRLLSGLNSPEDFHSLFASLAEDWPSSTSFVLRPPAESSGIGIARICTASDLAAYAAALNAAIPRLDPGNLSGQVAPLTLPLSPPEMLVVEPWIDTDPVCVVAAGGAGGGLEVQWEGSSSRWLEVTVGLVGELGSMSALPPTLVCQAADGSRHFITPPPEHILPQYCAEAAQGFAVALSYGLGLRSIASVDGFVNVDSGEFIVLDVKPFPALTDGSPILAQALQLDPPLLPHQLFRQLVREAWQTNQAAQDAAAAAGGSSSISSAFYSSPAEGGGAPGLGAADFELGGDIFGGSGGAAADFGAGGQGDEGDASGLMGDEDMQAAGWTV